MLTFVPLVDADFCAVYLMLIFVMFVSVMLYLWWLSEMLCLYFSPLCSVFRCLDSHTRML
jgi:hypothetical protein